MTKCEMKTYEGQVYEWFDFESEKQMRRYLREFDQLGIGYDVAHVVRFGAVLGQTLYVDEPESPFDSAWECVQKEGGA